MCLGDLRCGSQNRFEPRNRFGETLLRDQQLSQRKIDSRLVRGQLQRDLVTPMGLGPSSGAKTHPARPYNAWMFLG